MQREHRAISRGGRRALALGAALALTVAGSGTAFAAPSNPISGAEWALNYLNASQIRTLGAHGQGVVVAVIDSGVDPSQPDLQGRLIDGVNLVDPSDPTSNYSDTSSESHGTAVATIIAGFPHADKTYGMIGLADEAKIMPVKDGGDASSEASTAAGVKYAIAHGAQVINISEGPADAGSPVVAAINEALAAGVVVVVSAGNDAKTTNAPNPYAAIPGVLDVGGIDSNGQVYSFGHHGPDVSVAAPANDIEVGLIGGKYASDDHSGTSFAAPWVSGEAALLIAAHPTWTSGQVVAAIIDNTMEVAQHTSTSGKRVDDNVGYGVIDPVAALGAAEPSSTANPLGGPAITSNPAENLKNASSTGATAPGATGATGGATGSSPVASAKSSSTPLIIGIVVVIVILIVLLVLLLLRRNRGGRGGPGGGGGGGSNGYYTPQNPPGGQYAVPPQQHNPYQAPNPSNPYAQPQPQSQQGAPGAYPPPPQAGGGYGGGYSGGGQQQNPYPGH